MPTVLIKVSETDYQKYNLEKEEIKFTNLVEKINREHTRKALLACDEIVEKV